MMQVPRKHAELFWPRVVMRKWLNINSKESNFSADESDLRDENEREEEYYNSDDSQEENGDVDGDGDDKEVDEAWLQSNGVIDKTNFQHGGFGTETPPTSSLPAKISQLSVEVPTDWVPFVTVVESIPRRRRRNSETFRTQYINTKELRLCVGTWNIGGILPPDNLDTNDWLDTEELADIYVIGLQEMVPLNAGNIFGAEDSKPIPKWENIIRERLNRVQPVKPKFKCYSAPTSPSKFKPSEDVIDIEHELLTDTDTDSDSEEIHPSYDESSGIDEITRSESDELRRLKGRALERQFSSLNRFDKIYCLKKEDEVKKLEASTLPKPKKKLTKTLSGIERIGLSWPEPPMNFIGQHVLETPSLPVKSLKEFLLSGSFKSPPSMESKLSEDAGLVSEVPLINSRKRSPFVMIVSKQMVGVFISIWVRRSLRRHIHNLKVSTVGVGIMGYIGNKGSVSVSMSVYQTPFCFICSHLTSGEKDGDELKRNADVQEIHRRTRFRSVSGIGLPKAIHDHERIIWFGDLNYRINLPYTKTRRLISRKDWPKLIENDQLVRELKKGRAFDGWTEGILNFPPTYKYEHNSDKYRGEDPKAGRRNPAWCDRILSYGKGMRLLEYKRIENKLSDHRPVTAIYMVEVEVFSHRKLQKALAFTDAEVEDEAVVDNINLNIGLSRLRFGEDKLAPEPIGRKPFIICSITGYF